MSQAVEAISSPMPVTTLIGCFITVVGATAGVVLWFQTQMKNTRIELYRKINRNQDVHTETKVRVALLEQSHSHHESRMDGVDLKMDAMQLDITSIKENFTHLSQKQSENHLSIVGEIRGLGDKMTIQQLQKQVEK